MKCPYVLKINLPLFFSCMHYSCHTSQLKYTKTIWTTLYISQNARAILQINVWVICIPLFNCNQIRNFTPDSNKIEVRATTCVLQCSAGYTVYPTSKFDAILSCIWVILFYCTRHKIIGLTFLQTTSIRLGSSARSCFIRLGKFYVFIPFLEAMKKVF